VSFPSKCWWRNIVVEEKTSFFNWSRRRFNTKTNSLVWISEGARVVTYCFCLQNPCHQTADLSGTLWMNSICQATYKKEEQGPRNNSVLEGWHLTKLQNTLCEYRRAACTKDDNPASITKGGLIRLYQFDAKSRKNTAQYASLDPIAHRTQAKEPLRSMVYQQFNITARPIASGRTLLLHRNASLHYKSVFVWSQKRLTCKNLALKKYLILASKTNPQHGRFRNFINIEGLLLVQNWQMANNPLLFVSDNFSDKQKTQVLLLVE
jgi:hypothetical protein